MMSGAPEAITVVARWQMPEECVAEVLGLVARLREPSLAEPGCLGYEVYRSVNAAGELLLLERYRDEAAIEAHRGSSHFRELVIERIIPMLTRRRVELLRV